MTRPYQIPEGSECLFEISAARPLVNIPEETGTVLLEQVQDLRCLGVQLGVLVWASPEQGESVAGIESDSPIPGAKRTLAHPNEVPGQNQRVDAISGIGHSRCQRIAFENRGRDNGAGQPAHGVCKGVAASRRVRGDSLPGQAKSSQRRWLDRFDLIAQNGQRPSLESTEHRVVNPFPTLAAGSKGPFVDSTRMLEILERGLDNTVGKTQCCRGLY